MVFDNMENCANNNGTPYLRFYGHDSKTSDFIVCNKGDAEVVANVICLKLLVVRDNA